MGGLNQRSELQGGQFGVVECGCFRVDFRGTELGQGGVGNEQSRLNEGVGDWWFQFFVVDSGEVILPVRSLAALAPLFKLSLFASSVKGWAARPAAALISASWFSSSGFSAPAWAITAARIASALPKALTARPVVSWPVAGGGWAAGAIATLKTLFPKAISVITIAPVTSISAIVPLPSIRPLWTVAAFWPFPTVRAVLAPLRTGSVSLVWR